MVNEFEELKEYTYSEENGVQELLTWAGHVSVLA